jgi:hypothetical protein
MSGDGTELAGGVKHGFTGAMYVNVASDRVRVTMPDGRFGVFDGTGRWVEGDVYDVDPQLCVWMASDRIRSSHRLSPQDSSLSLSPGISRCGW